MAQIIMTKTQAKSRTSKAIEIRRRGLMGYLNDCKKILQGGKGMNLTQDEIAAYKSLKGLVSLTPADCTIDFIKAYIPTDEQGRFVRFLKVGENRAEWCEKHKVEPNDPQFTFVDGKYGSWWKAPTNERPDLPMTRYERIESKELFTYASVLAWVNRKFKTDYKEMFLERYFLECDDVISEC